MNFKIGNKYVFNKEFEKFDLSFSSSKFVRKYLSSSKIHVYSPISQDQGELDPPNMKNCPCFS